MKEGIPRSEFLRLLLIGGGIALLYDLATTPDFPVPEPQLGNELTNPEYAIFRKIVEDYLNRLEAEKIKRDSKYSGDIRLSSLEVPEDEKGKGLLSFQYVPNALDQRYGSLTVADIELGSSESDPARVSILVGEPKVHTVGDLQQFGEDFFNLPEEFNSMPWNITLSDDKLRTFYSKSFVDHNDFTWTGGFYFRRNSAIGDSGVLLSSAPGYFLDVVLPPGNNHHYSIPTAI